MTGLVRANALALPLRDESVDLIVTSPPYFALRSYQDGGEHYDGQIGSEPRPADFLDALWAVTQECKRVLKPGGSMWVNLGDKYAGSGGHNNAGLGTGNLGDDRMRSSTLSGGKRNALEAHKGGDRAKATRRSAPDSYNKAADVPAKSLMGLPWLYALGCTGALAGLGGPDPGLDLILRAEVVWDKPNGLPESVTDRVRRSHEQFFHFVKSPRYYSAVDEIRESRSEVVEPGAEHLPGCPLFRCPPHSDAPIRVRSGHERLGGVELFDLPDQVGPDERVEDQRVPCAEQEHEVGPSGSAVPLLVGTDPDLCEDAPHLVDDGGVAAVDVEPQVRAPIATVRERNRALSVDDASEPGPVCTCGHTTYHNPLGKLPGSVWRIASEPLRVPEHLPQHFAAFPQEWPRRLILGWSPPGWCQACGEPRRPVADVERTPFEGDPLDQRKRTSVVGGPRRWKDATRTITGYACACPDTSAPTTPAVVLDPFGGTGTTAMVARALGRTGISVDLSADYLRLARWRIFESAHAAKSRARTNAERQGVLL